METKLNLNQAIKQEVTQIDVTPNVNFLTTLRNSGYNNYTAIADIIDNSLDTDVDSKNVKVHIKRTRDDYEFIKICDDGCGMSIETLNEAFKLGALMGKNKEFDLGSYGTGLKAAALSLGRKFVVKTKSVDDDFYIATYDLDVMIMTNTFEIPVVIGTWEEYNEFKRETGSEIGTVVIVSKLDRITNANITVFKDILKSKLGLFYKYFIDELNINLFVNNEFVKSVDPMLRNETYSTCLTSNEKFEYNGSDFKFSVYNIEFVSQSLSNEVNRSSAYSGLYIYRNNRLVGSSLDLGIVGKVGDGHLNGLRIELFCSGDSDNLFGSTFNKIIHEKDKNEIDQGFRDVCKDYLRGYIKTVKNNEDSKTSNEKISDDVKGEMAEILKSINKNPFIGIKKERGKNEHPDIIPEKKEPVEDKVKNKFATRKREDKFADYRFTKLGENGLIFRCVKEHGLFIIEINQEHPFWMKFLNNASLQTKDVIIKMLFSLGVSLEETEYYNNPEKEDLLNEYFIKVSERLRKFIIY